MKTNQALILRVVMTRGEGGARGGGMEEVSPAGRVLRYDAVPQR